MADFKTYEHIVKWLGKGKRRTQGRKQRALMFRMVEDVVVVSHAQRVWLDINARKRGWDLTDFAEIRPNGMLTFTLDSSAMVPIAASVAMCLYRVLGLDWYRVGRGRYMIFVPEEGDRSRYWQAKSDNVKKYEHFKGMAWNWHTMECFNPRKPVLNTVDRDARKGWVAALKRFRRAYHTRAKLGVVDQIIQEYQAGKPWNVSAVGVDAAVLEVIKSGDVTTDFIMLLVACRATTGWRPKVDRKSVCDMLNTIINRNSVAYRQEFGVLRK